MSTNESLQDAVSPQAAALSSTTLSASIQTRRESNRKVKKPKYDLEDGVAYSPAASNENNNDSTTTGLTPAAVRSHSSSGGHHYQLKYCNQLLKELFSKRHLEYAWPFYKPVDVKGLGLIDYFDIITQPMDMGTIRVSLLFSLSSLFHWGSLFIEAKWVYWLLWFRKSSRAVSIHRRPSSATTWGSYSTIATSTMPQSRTWSLWRANLKKPLRFALPKCHRRHRNLSSPHIHHSRSHNSSRRVASTINSSLWTRHWSPRSNSSITVNCTAVSTCKTRPTHRCHLHRPHPALPLWHRQQTMQTKAIWVIWI